MTSQNLSIEELNPELKGLRERYQFDSADSITVIGEMQQGERFVPFITTLAMLAAARGLAEIISERRTQIVTVDGFRDFFSADILGVPLLVIIFALVAVGGWVLLNRTTFGRRTLAVGGNPEAARLAGINVNRHTVMLYVLVGFCCGLAALMLVSRTTTGSSTHGTSFISCHNRHMVVSTGGEPTSPLRALRSGNGCPADDSFMVRAAGSTTA